MFFRVLRRLSQLVSTAAGGASNGLYGKDDSDSFLTAKHITIEVSDLSIHTGGLAGGQGSHDSQCARMCPFAAHFKMHSEIHGDVNTQAKLDLRPNFSQ